MINMRYGSTSVIVDDSNTILGAAQRPMTERSPCAKRIFVCSPYSGEVERNVAIARRLCRVVIEAGHSPMAPHLLYPAFMDDADPEDRNRGLRCGLHFLEVCDEIWIYPYNGLSRGMIKEIVHAARAGVPILTFPENIADLKG